MCVYKKPQSETGNKRLREPHKTRSAKRTSAAEQKREQRTHAAPKNSSSLSSLATHPTSLPIYSRPVRCCPTSHALITGADNGQDSSQPPAPIPTPFFLNSSPTDGSAPRHGKRTKETGGGQADEGEFKAGGGDGYLLHTSSKAGKEDSKDNSKGRQNAGQEEGGIQGPGVGGDHSAEHSNSAEHSISSQRDAGDLHPLLQDVGGSGAGHDTAVISGNSQRRRTPGSKCKQGQRHKCSQSNH